MRNFLSNTAAGLVSGVISGAIILGAAALGADRIARIALNAHPTCAEPAGLQPLSNSAIASLSGSAEKAEGPSISYAPKSALDGRGGSIWIPKLVHTPENTRRGIIEFSQAPEDMLQIHFSSEQEVKLVCVVNGLANSYQNYENWGRVRTVKVWSDDASGIQTSVLQTLGSDTFPNAQFAARDLALSKDLSMQLVDAYSGLTIESFDPDVCLVKGQLVDAPNSVKPTVQPRFEQGCLVPPDSRAGISSIYLYVEQ